MRKLSSLLLAGGLAVTVTGCDEFLEPNPVTFASSATYYTTPGQFEQAINGLYSDLRGLFGGDWRDLTDFRSDVATLQYNTGVPGFTFVIDEFSENAVDGNVQGQWNIIHQTIFDSNVILGRIDAVEFPDAAQKARIVAEARFLRALAYWQGMQFWGLGEGWAPDNPAIPLITTEITEPGQAFELQRATVQQIYDFIIAELTAAKPDLPLRGTAGATGNNAGRITRGAAAFLLGATYQLNPAAAADALAQFTELTTAQHGYSLRPSHRDLFSPANKNNSESILEVQYNGAASITNNQLFQNLVGGMSPLNSAGGGNAGRADRIAMFGNAGGGGYMPAPDLVLAYNGADPGDVAPFDTRYRDDYGAFCPGSGTSGVTGAADVIASNQSGNTAWPDLNIASLRDPQTATVRSNCICYWIKWRWPDQGGLVLNGRDNNNWIAFRYADALLRIAEAQWRLNNPTAALAALNQVRARAGLTTPLSGLTGNALRDAIAEERKLELAAEGHRWFDLKRLGIATQVIENHGDFLRARNNLGTVRARIIQPDAYQLDGPASFRLRYPIRPRDVTLSGGLIQQNPGY